VNADTEELPEGWAWTTLPGVCEINPPKPRPDEYPADVPVTFVPMPAVDAELGAITNPSIRTFAEVRKGFTAFRDGDVILAKITPCMENGKAAVARGLRNGLGFGSTEFHVMRSNGSVLPDYVYYFIRQESFRKSAEQEMTGSVGQKRVPAEYLQTVEIPLPPLAEQKRIVAKVEEVLGRVTAARERLAKALAIIKQFRRATLTAATDGRLTAKWRDAQSGTPPDAAKLVNEIHQARLSSSESRKLLKLGEPVSRLVADDGLDGWCETRIGDVCECLDHLRIPVKKEKRGSGGLVPYYGANGQTGWIDRHLFDENLVLVVEDETFVGRELPFSYIIRGKSWVNNHAHVLRPLGGITADYLNIVLAHHDFVPLTSGTTGRRKLNQSALLNAPIRIAPLMEQQEIVRRVAALCKLADAVHLRLPAAAQRVEELPQAVLAKAFRGELVPTEAELARAEGCDYEPASALLERVRAERAAAPTPAKAGRRRKS
jgi:type I restriction enzyme S subunit